MISIEEYEKMENEEMPYTTDWGFTFEDIAVSCPDCDGELDGVKIRFNEYANSLDVKGVGLCKACKRVVTAKPVRLYRDGRISWREDDGTWVLRREPFKEKFKKWRKKWLRF